jgi:hypothetical protein
MINYLPYKYCQATFFIPIRGEERLGVQFFIYENRKKLRLGISKYKNVEGAAGYFTTNPNEGNFIEAEIHLDISVIGGGYVAHEIQHFVQWWIYKNSLKFIDEDFEKISDITGEMTSKFWDRFYDLYKEIKPGKKNENDSQPNQ